MTRRTVPMALFAVAVLVVAGAAIAATAAYFELRPAPGGGPNHLTLTDDLGRSVTVPTDPGRVAVLGPDLMDSMVRLGLRSHVVAVDCYAASATGLSNDYSPDQIAAWNLTSAMCIETAPVFNFEALTNASPDLVIASTIVTVSAVEQMQDQYHIPVLMLQPPSLSGIEVDVAVLGQIFGASSQATTLNGEMQAVLGHAQNITGNITNSGSPYPTVLVTYDVDPASGDYPGYWTFGPVSFGQSLIEVAGGVSISANTTTPYPLLTGSQVLVSDPTVIIFGSGFGLNESTYASGPDWYQFSAVQDHTVYGIDSNYLTEPDPTMILQGLPEILHDLHPALVAAA